MLKHIQSYIVHYAAVIAGICAVIAKINPSLLGPQGVSIIGAATAGIAIANALGIKPEVLAKAAALCLLALPVTLFTGCSTFSSITSNSASAAAVQAAVDIGVGTFIQQTAKTPAAQANEAAQITTIATALEGVLTGNQATLAQLDQMLQARIAAANLPPPDKAAALILAQTIQSIVLQQIQAATATGGTPPLSANQVVAIKTVLDDVLQAAAFYNVHAMAAMRADLAHP